MPIIELISETGAVALSVPRKGNAASASGVQLIASGYQRY